MHLGKSRIVIDKCQTINPHNPHSPIKAIYKYNPEGTLDFILHHNPTEHIGRVFTNRRGTIDEELSSLQCRWALI